MLCDLFWLTSLLTPVHHWTRPTNHIHFFQLPVDCQRFIESTLIGSICSGDSICYVQFFENNSSVFLHFIELNTEIQRYVTRALSLFNEIPESTHRSADVWVTCNYGGRKTLSQPEKLQQRHGFSANVEFFSPSSCLRSDPKPVT